MTAPTRRDEATSVPSAPSAYRPEIPGVAGTSMGEESAAGAAVLVRAVPGRGGTGTPVPEGYAGTSAVHDAEEGTGGAVAGPGCPVCGWTRFTAVQNVVVGARSRSAGRMMPLVAWVAANHDRRVSVGVIPQEVAALTGTIPVSLPVLQSNCERHLGVSLTGLIRNVRLHRAYQLLRAAEPAPGEVPRIAARVGYTHMSRFAGDYRARYGELPTQTLNRAPESLPEVDDPHFTMGDIPIPCPVALLGPPSRPRTGPELPAPEATVTPWPGITVEPAMIVVGCPVCGCVPEPGAPRMPSGSPREDPGDPGGRSERAREMVAWLAGNHQRADALSKVLPGVLKVAWSCVHHHSQLYVGAQPGAILRAIRLHHAYGLLLAARPEAGKVAEIARLVGYRSLSAFRHAYRSRYGETPSETLTRAWDAGAHAAVFHDGHFTRGDTPILCPVTLLAEVTPP